MSYSYNSPVSYYNQPGGIEYNPAANNQHVNEQSGSPFVGAGIVAGAIGGGIVGNNKNPYMTKAGEPTDQFAIDVYKRYVKKNPEAGREKYNQGLNILKKLNSVKSADELKELLKNNADAANDIYVEAGKTADEFLKEVTDTTLTGNKNTIKDKINAGNKTRYQDIKNKIVALWDKETKKFVKADGTDENVYKAIQNVKGKAKASMIGKYAVIGAVITGIAAYLIQRIAASKKDISKH